MHVKATHALWENAPSKNIVSLQRLSVFPYLHRRQKRYKYGFTCHYVHITTIW